MSQESEGKSWAKLREKENSKKVVKSYRDSALSKGRCRAESGDMGAEMASAGGSWN